MADLNKIIDELSTLTVVEAAELSKQLEEKWGVSSSSCCSSTSRQEQQHRQVKKI